MKNTRTKHLLCLLSAAILLSMSACGEGLSEKRDDDVPNNQVKETLASKNEQSDEPDTQSTVKPNTKPGEDSETERVNDSEAEEETEYEIDEETEEETAEPETDLTLPEVYRVYSGIKEIGTFHQGLAPFIIQNSNVEAYGYINIQGEVVI